MRGGIGASSAQKANLQKAVVNVLECAHDQTKFLNQCEPVLYEFKRAVDQVHRRQFSDEAQIFASINQKEAIVHFLNDCVRNRFLLWQNVRGVKEVLTEADPSWSAAYKRHLAACPTCRTVDLSRARTPPEPGVRWPIPFLLELLALLGLALPIIALGQGCDCRWRPWLLALGLILILPCLAFEMLWRYRRARVLSHLVKGPYAVGMQRHPPGCLWRPSLALFVDAPVATKPAPSLRARPQEPEEPQEATYASFGTWNKTQPQQSAIINVSGAPGLADSGSESGTSISSVSAYWGAAGSSAASSSASESDTGPAYWMLRVTCASRKWESRSATMNGDGSVEGLGTPCNFDGDSLVFDGKSDAWVKLGFLRLDWLRKTLISLATVGVLMTVAAVVFEPGIVENCVPYSESTEIPTALEAYLLLDASGSMTESWKDELQAANAIIQGFQDTYRGRSEDLYVGAGQFSSDVRHEVDISNDMASTKRIIGGLQMRSGGTRTDKGLKLCERKLTEFNGGTKPGGAEPFKVCVLITDGAPTDRQKAMAASAGVLDSNIAIMGILVGSVSGNDLKRTTSCSRWSESGTCPWYVEFTDWRRLSDQAKDIAAGITSSIQTTVVTAAPYDCDPPVWTLLALGLVAPMLAWWLYLHRCKPAAPDTLARKDPERLKAAGRNPGRGNVAAGVEGETGPKQCTLQ